MDLTKYRDKLVGNEEERAVSPVIGVILMVAITVILAAVIAAFVLDLGDDIGDGTVNAGVSTDVSDADETVTITIDSIGDAEYLVVRGDIQIDRETFEDDGDMDWETGESVTIADGNSAGEGDIELDDDEMGEDGEANVVAVAGDSETVVTSFEWDDWELNG